MSPIDEAALRHTREAPERRFERVRLEPIVGVEKEDEVRIERSQSGIARGSQPAILLTNQLRAGKPSHDRRRIVGGPVVHDDDGSQAIAPG